MKTIIKLEELGLLLLGIYFFSILNYPWWWFFTLILAPDFSMVGYVFGNKIGAFSYNIFHHRGIAIIIYLIGIYFHQNEIQLAGVILFAHSSLDRMLGYGLKYEKGFKYTHLGLIGKQ
ncbi:hypothetical protein IWX84_000187 [Flavobacterium sp. CG_9.10]|uniref:DUF4260 domain-containing protein n=1 Tax=Flavobacterium sp. CG_9.10 TaxID=2787729 RepID=UPI0018C98184|nr:DUF4260 domain-containing protein [Flavobacterium sp. CG_9.10]MBG6109332.1 hypothetical protein [Flavobacterium sp. CG_9.10]